MKAIADEISQKLGIPVRTGRRFLHELLDGIAGDLEVTGRSEIRGLGTFAVFRQPERRTRHPRTGEPIVVPSFLTVRYRTSARLRRRLNPGLDVADL
jgi:nucleoid DNA-binding protein